MERYERIKEILEGLGNAEIIRVHNEYCENYGSMDDYIYSMDDFDEIMEGQSPLEIVRRCFYGRYFNPADDFFHFNGYGNLESFNYADNTNSSIYISDIAKYINDNEESFGLDEIEEIFEEGFDEEE